MTKLNDILISLPAFIIGISILVAVHEFGHFWVARRLGIKTLRFSIGFGRVLWSRFGKDGTEYAISAIPMGGYVRMLDEREGNVAEVDLPRAFNRQPVWKRIAVLVAGPGFNFVFAIVAYWFLLTMGVPGYTPVVGSVLPHSLAADAGLQRDDLIQSVDGQPVQSREAAVMKMIQTVVDDGIVQLGVKGKDGQQRTVSLLAANRSRELTQPDALLPGLGFNFWPSIPAVVGKLLPDGAAARAGFRVGDKIVAVDGEPIEDFEALQVLGEARGNREVPFELQREGELLTVQVKVAMMDDKGRAVGRIGVSPAPITVTVPAEMYAVQRYSGFDAFTGAVYKTWDTSAFTVKLLWKVLAGKVSMKSISGPIGIATVAGMAAKQGAIAFISLLALISISVGILNLMPIPILDGGQIVYQLAELLKGGPVSERAQLLGQQVGIVLLMLLMGLAIFNDLAPHLS